jgi:hypothetical protein
VAPLVIAQIVDSHLATFAEIFPEIRALKVVCATILPILEDALEAGKFDVGELAASHRPADITILVLRLLGIS